MASARASGDISFSAEKRTNSLAFSRTYCHTCLAKGITCDRRRPKCGPCLAEGKDCGGFAQPLSWKDTWLARSNTQRIFDVPNSAAGEDQHRAARLVETPSSFATPTSSGRRVPGVQLLRFINVDAPLKKRRRTTYSRPRGRHSTGGTERAGTTADRGARAADLGVDNTICSSPQVASIDSDDDDDGRDDLEEVTVDQAESSRDETLTASVQDIQCSSSVDPVVGPEAFRIMSPLMRESGFEYTISSNISDLLLPDPFAFLDVSQDSFPELQQDTAAISSSNNPAEFESEASLSSSTPPNGPCQTETMQMPIITIAGGSDQAWLLERYDAEFCILPITSDIPVNPFRIHSQSWQRSPLLLHAVLALCWQHIHHSTPGAWAQEATNHREKAVELLDYVSSPDSPLTNTDLSLLDSILVLFTLDCLTSAFGKWKQHLCRARALLEANGGVEALETPRVQAQVAMLAWWDATLAIISRRGLTLPRRYFDHLYTTEKNADWSFYGLTGCPGSLVKILIDLAELAEQKELSLSMRWLHLDAAPVRAIEAALRTWTNPYAEDDGESSPEPECASDDITATAEEEIHDRCDRFHVSEAWRFALLTFVYRILHWDRRSPPPKALKRTARAALDHVRCCRQTSQTQKQALLPVFLAGSEIQDEETRKSATSYCQWWTIRSRYNMFATVTILLEQIWSDQDSKGRSVWWGSILDKLSGCSTYNETGHDISQFLFG